MLDSPPGRLFGTVVPGCPSTLVPLRTGHRGGRVRRSRSVGPPITLPAAWRSRVMTGLALGLAVDPSLFESGAHLGECQAKPPAQPPSRQGSSTVAGQGRHSRVRLRAHGWTSASSVPWVPPQFISWWVLQAIGSSICSVGWMPNLRGPSLNPVSRGQLPYVCQRSMRRRICFRGPYVS